jgi:diaminohydroxyphosphoribosylaminopyrimidine deaminase/5-amino-6-(5-phosphoribosylamino)uracil reductase
MAAPAASERRLADENHMRAALNLAARGLGLVAPNPSVGCVIVRDGRVVGRGWTQPGGRPHAETEALRRAGMLARGATAYVTLEPCAHHGKTPPCAEALIEAGIARVVVACLDTDERVSGRGVQRLEDAGIRVEIGVGADAALDLNAGFFLRNAEGRPLVTLKTATSLDGRIATRTGESKWITGETARARGHLLRARHDAIMVGVGTVAADDPELNCRLPGLGDASPVRVVADGRLRTPLTSRLVRTAGERPTWIVTVDGPDAARARAFRDCGVDLIEVPADAAGNPSPRAALAALAKRGITRVLVEGGGRLSASLMREDLVDRVVWFRGALALGGDGRPAIAPYGLDHLDKARRFRRLSLDEVGDDALETYVVRA